jgi:hypothetical protein
MVHDQPSHPFIPTMHAFHHPTDGQREKSIGMGLQFKQLSLLWALPAPYVFVAQMPDHINNDTVVVLNRLGRLARVGAQTAFQSSGTSRPPALPLRKRHRGLVNCPPRC